MKHLNELNQIIRKLDDKRSTRKSIYKEVKKYVQLFESKDELATELNNYKNDPAKKPLSRAILNPLVFCAVKLPGEQTVLWQTFQDPEMPETTFEDYIPYLEKIYAYACFAPDYFDIYKD